MIYTLFHLSGAAMISPLSFQLEALGEKTSVAAQSNSPKKKTILSQ
jgi:hypothetical protein